MLTVTSCPLPLCVELTAFFQYHQSVIDNAREAEKSQAGRPLAIALDTVCIKLDEAELQETHSMALVERT